MAIASSVSAIAPPTSTQQTAAGTQSAFEVPTTTFFVTTTGDLVCRFANDDADRTIPVTAGTQLSARLTFVRAGSTAEVLVGWS